MTISQHSQIGTDYASSCRVKTPSAVTVGSIKEFVINTFTGEVDYVVLKVDEGFLNLGSKLLALPFESFEFNTAQEDVVIVKESKETLESAPGFDEDHLPEEPQPEFLHSMRSYYSEESRSLYGRYDRDNRSFFDDDSRYDKSFGNTDNRGSRSFLDGDDQVNRNLLDEDDSFGTTPDTMRDRDTGHGFLEKDHRGDRQSDRRRGGDPLL